ncbi:MAG: dethiobiotin synthase [Planctomycetota bacterium]
MDLIFVGGTDTDVGKTVVASRLAKRLSAKTRLGVYKPVASGCIPDDNNTWLSTDARELWLAAGSPREMDAVCPQRFGAALAPAEAARAEGRTVDIAKMLDGAKSWQPFCDTLIVEGAGGLFSPLADGVLNIDFFHSLKSISASPELLLVAANRLGVIHQVISTIRAAMADGVSIDHLMLSTVTAEPDESVATNAKEIARWFPQLNIECLGWINDA